ncbi:MAG: pilus assembly protein [Actinomycetota bacterium]|nr:pilus assembly protein [Actinomycetota bacterium]
MARLLRREEGAAALEFGLVLPILVLLAALTFPLLKAGYEYIVLSRAVSHGIRYASRADENPRPGPAGLTRRPTQQEVADFIRRSAPQISICETCIAVTPDPSGALPGERIQIEASYQVSYGVLDDIANSVNRVLFRGGAYLPESQPVTVSAWGREE